MTKWKLQNTDFYDNVTHIVICKDPYPDAGGIENMGYWLSRTLAQNVNKVILIGTKKALIENHFPEDNIYKVYLKNNFSFKNLDIIYFVTKLIYLRLFVGKKVYVYSIFLRNMKGLKWLKKITKWKYITYIHGNEILKFKNKHIDEINSLLKKNDKIVSVSSYTANIIQDVEINKKVLINPPGLSPDFIKDLNNLTVAEKYMLSGKPKILMLGRLIERKGHNTCIQAVKMLITKYPDIRLYIAGKGPAKSNIEQCIKSNNLDNNVIFLGFISEKDKPLIYKQVDVYCMPSMLDKKKSEVEGFGITFLEAAAARAIPIGANVGGMTDAIEHSKSGFLVDPGAVEQLSSILDDIFSRPEDYEHMRNYAQHRAINKFSWQKHVDTLLDNLP